MASWRPSLASSACTPVFWADAAGPEAAAPGTAVGLPPTPQVVVVVPGPVVLVVPVVSVVDDEAATSAPAGAGVGAMTTVTAPAIDSPASSAAVTARRGDS